MNRLERVREIVDGILLDVASREDLRCGFIHLYGVSATAVWLARCRGLNEELAGIAGMLHDLVSYESGDEVDHASRGATRAAEILTAMDAFSEPEIASIASAIEHHSDKASIHGPYEELLKDADVWQHDLYNPALPAHPRHAERRSRLRRTVSGG